MTHNEVSEMGCAYWTTGTIILRLPREEDGLRKMNRYVVLNLADLMIVRQLQDGKHMKAVTCVHQRFAALTMMTVLTMTTMIVAIKRRKDMRDFLLH